MVFENRSYGSVRAPPLPIIRDHSKLHHATRVSPDSATNTTTTTTKCNGTTTTTTSRQLFNLAQADKTGTNGHTTNGHGAARCTPTTTTNGRPPIARSASVSFQAGRLRRAQRKPLTIREYESDFRQQASDLRLVERVFHGGMQGNQLRAALWPYIFGLVPERGHFVPRTSASINGFHSAAGMANGNSGGRNTSPRSGGEYIYIEHEKNVERWGELKQLYKTYKRQWRSIQPDQELRFSVFRERKSLIERDVVRSDRTHPFYAHDSAQAAANLKALTTLLMTYMMYDFDIGYLQGMSDLAAPILYVYDGDLVKSFWVFVEVMKLFRRNFEQSQKSIHFQLNCLNRLIKMTDPKLANYLRENDCSNCFFVFRCIVCQFKRELMKSSGSRAASQEEVNGGDDADEQHSDLTSSTEEDDDDDDDGDCSSLDGGLRRHNGGGGVPVSSSAAAAAAHEDSYGKVLNLWDTIWSVQRRHELLAQSKYVHTYRIANGERRKTGQGSSAHAQHKHAHQHHHHRHPNKHNNQQHHNHQRMSSPINISSTTTSTPTTTTTTTNGADHGQRAYHTNGTNQQQQQKLSSHNSHSNSIPRSPSSTTSAPTRAASTTTTTTARLNHQLNRAAGQGRHSPKLTTTSGTTANGHLSSCSPQTNGTHPGQRQQFLKRHSVGSLSSLGSSSCCSQCCGQSANDGSRTAPVKQEEIVYTKETFYSSFDPNQADVPRFELTETEKFVLALCVSLIRRERNAILSQQMGVSEIHQHFINPPRLAENFDAFAEQAYETYKYLNTDCDLQLLVKGASELSGGAASDLSPICGPATTANTNGTGNTVNSTDTADTYDLLKDYFVISPTAYNVSMSSLSNLPSSLSNSNLATSQNFSNSNNNNNNSHLISSSTHNNNSISTSDLNNRGGGAGLKKRLSYCGGGGSSGGSVSHKLWDHFLNSKTLNMQ